MKREKILQPVEKPEIPKQEEDTEMVERIETITREIGPEIVGQRDYLRQNPELGLAPETAKYVGERLKSLGFEVKEGVGETGVVATLKGGKETKVIAFKGSLDAVPVQDGIKGKIRSKVSNISHTCGHAGEMAAMLGTAEVLSRIPASERGTVKLIFQPNEERFIVQRSYALKMANEGALEGVNAIVELHPTTLFPENTLLCPEGRLNAASGRYKVMVHPREQDVFEGKTPDANTLVSLITARMGKHEPQPEQLRDVLVRTPFHVTMGKRALKEVAREFGVPSESFVSFKITLRGPGGHAGVSKEAPNLNLLSSEIVSRLYEKYGNSVFSFSESAGQPAYNVLTTQTELWVSIKGREKLEEFQQSIKEVLAEVITDLPVEKDLQEEQIDKVPFASQVESWSTVRVGEADYFGPRKDIFSDLARVLTSEMERVGLTKPDSVKGAGEKMPCPPGEWRLYYQKGTPPQFNSPELVRVVEQAAKEFGITEFNKKPITAGSDFPYMQKPGVETALIAWGCVSPNEYQKFRDQKIGHHHPKFIETPESIIRTSKILARAAEIFWQKEAVEKP